MPIGVVGHAGDGNLHPNIVFDRADPASVDRGQRAFDEIMERGLALGGTCTGEHGVGCLKRDWLGASSARSASTCTARSRPRSTPPGCSTPARCSAGRPGLTLAAVAETWPHEV